MGGVDLWQNEDDDYDNFDPQSMHDRILEVVSISGTWHLGKLQVNSASNYKSQTQRNTEYISPLFRSNLMRKYFKLFSR